MAERHLPVSFWEGNYRKLTLFLAARSAIHTYMDIHLVLIIFDHGNLVFIDVAIIVHPVHNTQNNIRHGHSALCL